MKYNEGEKTLRKLHKKLALLIVALLLMGGVYILALSLSPRLISRIDPTVIKPVNQKDISYGEHQIIIPKIGVQIDFLEGNAHILEIAAWHRFPERGNPEIGGNFIISAHRFSIGWTPQQTRKKSPFYNINRLGPGDDIFADYKGKRYHYIVQRQYSVKPTEISIEAPSDTAKLTLYSCTLKGSADGRAVVEALPVK